jgi:hypothetical protein
MQRSYFEIQRQHDIAAVARCPYDLGRSAMFGASRSLVGVEMEALVQFAGVPLVSATWRKC